MNEHHDKHHETNKEYLDHVWDEHSVFGLMAECAFKSAAESVQRHTHSQDEIACSDKLAEATVSFLAELVKQEARCKQRVARARETMVQKHARIAAVIKDRLEHGHKI